LDIVLGIYTDEKEKGCSKSPITRGAAKKRLARGGTQCKGGATEGGGIKWGPWGESIVGAEKVLFGKKRSGLDQKGCLTDTNRITKGKQKKGGGVRADPPGKKEVVISHPLEGENPDQMGNDDPGLGGKRRRL